MEDLVALPRVALAAGAGSEMPASPVGDVAWTELEGREGPSSCR